MAKKNQSGKRSEQEKTKGVHYIFFSNREKIYALVLALVVIACTSMFIHKQTAISSIWPLGTLTENVSFYSHDSSAVEIKTSTGHYLIQSSIFGLKGAKTDLVERKSGKFYLCVNKEPGGDCIALRKEAGEALRDQVN